ncbi:Alcohol dehydrogenase, C-terminal [Artemisia annua]|uniref:Alcohol dehydrogenase, C-terminal n=1 Tax=Artemisia annua TaxID=35608 RepID=A0A2U1P0P3_ARTAN|nr:Alcohol dehydrogenase, C-terminal [Artemisia annua]
MKLKPGLSAFITGGASGIGRALCIALAQKGIFVTVVDFSEDKGKEVVSILLKENLKFHPGLKYPSSIFVKCDVTNKEQVAAAFEKHVEVYGGLDICINSAGILSFVPFHMDETDGSRSWRHAINVNLVGVIDCTHRAIKIMEAAKKPGVIINMGSAAGLYPMITDPIYSSTKGGVVMFTRALAPYKRKGIRVNVICPEIVRMDMGETTESRYIDIMGGYISMNTMIQGHVLLKIIYAGVNASDVNFSSGSYFSGSKKEISSRLPFDAGFEGVGLVAAVGDGVKNLKVGTLAAVMTFGSYAEFSLVPATYILPVARPDPEVVAMLTSGLTASIALEKLAQMEFGKTVLVTAAAGGTGQFVVQQVLKKEFPKGVDIVYESVGGDMFDTCFNALAVYGRMVIIGMISQVKPFSDIAYAFQYQGENGWKPRNYIGLCEKLLTKSQTMAFAGFFLVQFIRCSFVYTYLVAIDPKSFVGVQSVADAVEYLHSGKSVGKVVVCIDPSFSQQTAKL